MRSRLLYWRGKVRPARYLKKGLDSPSLQRTGRIEMRSFSNVFELVYLGHKDREELDIEEETREPGMCHAHRVQYKEVSPQPTFEIVPCSLTSMGHYLHRHYGFCKSPLLYSIVPTKCGTFTPSQHLNVLCCPCSSIVNRESTPLQQRRPIFPPEMPNSAPPQSVVLSGVKS